MCLEREQLIIFFSNTTLADIPKAELNMRQIFGNKLKGDTCLKRFNFDSATLTQINIIIEQLKDSRHFNKPDATTAQVAATVYYVKNINGDRSFTYTFLAKEFRISADTIRKSVKIIEKEYH
jgi:hypothetical protein